MTKKQILWLLLFLILLVLIIIYKCCNPPKPVVLNGYRPKEFIVSYRTYNPKVREDLIEQGYKLKDTCACSEQLELYEATTEIIPETTDVRGGSGGGGANGIGNGFPTVIRNYIVQDNIRLDTAFVFRINRDNQIVDTVPERFRLSNRYLQPQDTTSEVIIAIIDSGVDEYSMIELDRDASMNLLPTRLYRNYGDKKFCGTNISEGNYGMNILKAMGIDIDSNPLDEDGHGTFINGVIAGVARPLGTHLGDNRNVRFKQLNVKFAKNRNTPGALFDALCGVHYALGKGAKVINASWRSLTVTGGEENSIKEFFYPTLNALKSKDALLVTGSGNDELNLDLGDKAWPACFSTHPDYKNNVITVGAWNIDSSKISFFSNFGAYVDVYAPGADIISIGLNDGTPFKRTIMRGQGTSYAAPFVAREAAILRGMLPSNTPAGEIKARIVATTTIAPQNNTVKLLHHENAIQNRRR